MIALSIASWTCLIVGTIGIVMVLWALLAPAPPAAPQHLGAIVRVRVWIRARIAGFSVLSSVVLIVGLWLLFIPHVQPAKWQEDPKELARVSAPPGDQQEVAKQMWMRYEQMHAEFSQKAKVNWYFYANLKVLIILLGALTPVLVLVVAANRKWAPALTAAIVAIAAGAISEFDFRQENARYEDALAALENHRARFIAHAGADYRVCPQTAYVCPNADESDPVRCTFDGQVCHEWLTTLDTFVDQIEQIVRDERDGRIRFLRGTEGKESQPAKDTKNTKKDTKNTKKATAKGTTK